MPLEESGVNLVVEGLASFLGGLAEGNDAIGDLANTAAGVGAAGFSALGDAASAVGDVVAGAFTAALAVGVAGIAALAGGIAYGIGQAIEAEAAVANLNRMIVNLGEDAPITTQGALDLAAQFQGLALGSDDAVLAIIDLGVKSRNISEEEFPAFIQSSLDLGAVMGDNATAARLLARAQEDPLGVLGPLRRQGILFTEEQEAQIKTLQASGDVAGAYAIVMEQVGAVTGGAALTNTQTLSGMIETFKNTLGEAWETIGTAFLPALHAIGDVITTSVLPFVTEFATQFANLLMGVSDGSDLFALISDALVAAFGPETGGMVAGVIGQIWDALNSIFAFAMENMPAIQATFSEVWSNIQIILTEVGGLIIGTIIPYLSALFEAIFGPAPNAQEALDAVLTALSEGSAMAAVFVRDILVPAIETLYTWLVDNVIPALASAVDWLQVNVPIAIQMASDFWTNVLQPALAAVWTFITTVLVPAISDLATWLQTNLPIAIQAVTNFWNTVLLPAINAIWSFITTSLVPGIVTLVDTFMGVLIPASTAVSDFYTNILLPAFTAIWTFTTDSLIPLITALAGVFTAVLGVALEVVVALFNEHVAPSLAYLASFISLTLQPVLTMLAIVITETVVPAIEYGLLIAVNLISESLERAGSFVGALIDWLDNLSAAINAIDWGLLTPGSPTPFEIGLRGAADAMAELAKQVNPLDTALAELNRNALGSASAALEQIINPVMVADRAAATPTTINNYNTADIDIHGANVGRNRQTVTDDVLLGLQLGFGLST